MGARMLRDELHRQGVQVGRHITTLMRRVGIQALAPQPGTSKRAPGHHIYPYLAVPRPDQVWALATTYIPMARGKDHEQRTATAGCVNAQARNRRLEPVAGMNRAAICPFKRTAGGDAASCLATL